MKESLLVSAAIKYLWSQGCFVWRQNTGGFKDARGHYVKFGLAGTPDVIGMTISGRFIAIECKSDKGKLSDKQEAFRDKIIAHNGLYVLAYSLDDIIAREGEIR